MAGADSAARLAALLQLLVRVASVLGTLAEISYHKADMSKTHFSSDIHSTLLLVALASSAHVLGPAVSVLCADTVVKGRAVALADRGCQCIHIYLI